MRNSKHSSSIYISYAWEPEGERIADAIEQKFALNGVDVVRDKSNLKYKGRIKEFMQDIGLGKYVILIISNKYLRSENCMYELIQIFKNSDFYERIFPIVMSDVKIAKASERLDLVNYWESETNLLNSGVRELKDLSNIQGLTDDINLYTEIRHNVANLTNILKDINTLSVEKHIDSNFQNVYKAIQLKTIDDRSFNKLSSLSRKDNNPFKIIGFFSGVIIIGIILVKFFSQPIPILEPEEKELYTVQLNVDSSMVDAEVFVDKKPAKIEKRNGTNIFITLKDRDSGYEILVKKKSNECITLVNIDSIINRDSIKINIPYKLISRKIQYCKVKLKVNTNMVDGDVYVNEKRLDSTDILIRSGTFIIVRVKKSNKLYKFEIDNGDIGFCKTERIIKKDFEELLMQC